MNVVKFENHKSRMLMLLGTHLIWGLILWWSVSTYGLGTSRDSVEYLFTSLSITKGEGFISFLGQPYTLWPPLYPILLSLSQIAGVVNPLDAALVLQLVTFVWISILISWLFLRLFPQNFFLALVGNVLAGTGVALTWLFQSVGSDYLFIALTLSMVYLCDQYITHNRMSTIWLMILASALSMLQRYIGITVLLSCFLIVFQYSRVTIEGKIKRSALLSVSLIPILVWALSLPREALVRDAPSSLLENVYWFTFSILSWLVPEAELYGHPVRLQFGIWGVWLGILVGGIIFWKLPKKSSITASVQVPLFLFGVVYTGVVIVVASLSSFNSLDSRFVSPIFIPLIALIIWLFDRFLSSAFVGLKYVKAVFPPSIYILLLVTLGVSANRSMTSVRLHHDAGDGYTSSTWKSNDVILYWLSHQPDGEYLSFSNYPAGIAVRSWHATFSSPRRTAHPNVGEEIIPLVTYIPTLFAVGKDAYIIWIEPNEYIHVYSIDDLREIVEVEVMYESRDGGIYKILPKIIHE